MVRIENMTGAAPPLKIVDAHHHLWDLGAVSYPWLEAEVDPTGPIGDYSALQRDYLVTSYLSDIGSNGVVASVHVQAECDPADPVAETRWLQAVADRHGLPNAIVGGVKLESEDAESVLAGHREAPLFRGVRQMLDRGDGRQLLSNDRWRRGLRLLARHDLSFDLQVTSDQLEDAAALATQNDDIVFVLNHCGWPADRSAAGLDQWRRGIRALSALPHVFVKVSGLAMFDRDLTPESAQPIVGELFDAFGVERCLFGSNFPVDKLFVSYDEVRRCLMECTRTLSVPERNAFFYDNAYRVYRLPAPSRGAEYDPLGGERKPETVEARQGDD
jgi:predicted TIM-barrel fold metal-dependent hydrolase